MVMRERTWLEGGWGRIAGIYKEGRIEDYRVVREFNAI